MSRNTRINRYKSDSEDSNEDNTDIYESALQSNMSNLINPVNNNIMASNSSSKNQFIIDKKPTESRIEFVKSILEGKKLKPMIDLDDYNTEAFTNDKLNKRILDAKNLFSSMNVKLDYVKSGTTGHLFKAIFIDDETVAFAVKVCAYPKDDYGGINHRSRPENVELRILKLLSYFVVHKKTPHFVLPIGTFNTDIKKFINIPESVIDIRDEKNEMYRKFIERYRDGEFESFVSVLISEWCNGGDLLDYIRKNYRTMTLRHWTIIFFQILFTLAVIHDKYPSFRHNDMKANNILVELTNISQNKQIRHYGYNMGSVKFIIPNIDLQIKIWDFDFACVSPTIENNKVNSDWTNNINITNKENKYYDMHYFFNTLISKRFFPQFYEEGGVPPEIVEFVHRVVPEKFRNGSPDVNKKGRIQVDEEYTTPYKVIIKDKLFEKYRYKLF